MSLSADDEELFAVIKETVPPGKRRGLKVESTLRQAGIDSMTLVIIVGRFLEKYPVPVEPLQEQLAAVKTIGQLLELGRVARATWVSENGQA
jgi:acyl carrier protein